MLNRSKHTGLTVVQVLCQLEFGLRGGRVVSSKKTLKPGETAPASGQYEIVGPRGGRSGEERTVTRGEPMPPTPESGQRYIIVDPTKNRSGRG